MFHVKHAKLFKKYLLNVFKKKDILNLIAKKQSITSKTMENQAKII